MNWFPLCATAAILSGWAMAATAPRTESKPADAPALVRAADALLTNAIRRPDRVGLSVALVHEGQLLLAKGYGHASLATPKQPVTTQTLFAIGSITKQFTCACLLLLAEQGKLSIHDTVAKYFPQLTRAGDISLLDLMNHTSGYPDYYPLDFVDRRMRQPVTTEDVIQRYCTGKLDFEPGSKYSYSNTGYLILGRVVEKVSGQDFATFLAEKILNPLGMKDTVYEPPPSHPRLANGYTSFALSPPESVAPEATGWIGAAGGLYATPSDLAKWCLALEGGRLLKPESYALMTTPRQLTSGRFSDYGCGLRITMQGGYRILSHGGAVAGFSAHCAILPASRSAVVVMSNMDEGLGNVPGQILELLTRDQTRYVPQVSGPAALEAVKSIFAQFQRGKVDRAAFSEEFNYYLTPQRLTDAARELKPFGKPATAAPLNSWERGGMEVTVTRLTFKAGRLRILMYRQPGGLVEQFFVYPD